MLKDLSRRAMLAGAAALTPAIATLPGSALASHGEDAELLDLGKNLGEVEQERKILNAAVAAGADISDACGAMFCTRLDAFARNILSRKAQSVAGLAVQTRAITLAAADLWEGNLPQNKSYECAFIEAVARFVGIEVPTPAGTVS